MFLKIAYSAVLLIASLAALGELYRVWSDNKLYIGPFTYGSGGNEVKDKGTDFARKVSLAHSLVFRQLQEYASLGVGGPSDTTYNIATNERPTRSENQFEDLTLTYENVDIGKLLSRLHAAIVQPNEISGTVTDLDGRIWANVSWPRAPTIDGRSETMFAIDGQVDDSAVARQIACGIAWAQLAAKSDPAVLPLRKMGRSQFCQLTDSIALYFNAVAKRITPTVAMIDNLREQLKRTLDQGIEYPDLYRLRADLTDLMPNDERTKLLVEAQNDRLTYALLTDKVLQSMPEHKRRMLALALARPAIPMSEFREMKVTANWKHVLTPYTDKISRNAGAVGIIYDENNKPCGTGFRVGQNAVMTVKYTLPRASRAARAGGVDNSCDRTPISKLKFCLTDKVSDICVEGRSYPVIGVLSDANDKSFIVVLKVDFSGGPIGTLALRNIDAAADALVDKYVYIIGYPAYSSKVDQIWIDALLKGVPGVQRILPGRTLTLQRHRRLASDGRMISTDISTSKDTPGSPLIDLATGEVIGVLIGGRQDDKGSLTYAEVVSAAHFKTVNDSN